MADWRARSPASSLAASFWTRTRVTLHHRGGPQPAPPPPPRVTREDNKVRIAWGEVPGPNPRHRSRSGMRYLELFDGRDLEHAGGGGTAG